MVTRNRSNRTVRTAFAAVAAAGIVLGLGPADRGGAAAPRCTHGVSSIGPVYLKDGKVVGNATPHTEACLP